MTDGECFPTGNHEVSLFIDMIVCYYGAKTSESDSEAIQTACTDAVRKARALGPDVTVDFSACHSQQRDARVADLFGGITVSFVVRDIKSSVDPSNHFCFHPFGGLYTQKPNCYLRVHLKRLIARIFIIRYPHCCCWFHPLRLPSPIASPPQHSSIPRLPLK